MRYIRFMTELIGTGSISDFNHGAFLRGAAAAFDLRGNTTRLFGYAPSPQVADRLACLNDMQVVIQDSKAVAQGSRSE